MTVSVLRNKAQYTGNGSSTQFEITFAYTETSQIKVYLDGSLQTITTHYTITDPGQTGTVTFLTAPQSGVVISLIRETDYLQTVDYANNDILDAETLESAFDKLTMMCQQLKSLIDGSVGFDETVSDAETTSLKLAAGITDLAGKLLAFDATGNFVTTQEIGTWQGDYSASTAYVVRDIVKDPSTDNVYFTKQNSPAGTSLSNTTYFALLVDVETVRTLKEAAELAESNAETAQAAAEAALASFQGQYKVGATNPYSGTPDAGDLWYDTTNSILKYYVSGTGFEPVTTSLATVTDNYLTISNQVITAGTVPISLGGTGATGASGARTALGLAIGTDVQAYDADTAKYDDTTANFTGTLQNGGSNVVVDSDIGSTVQAYDADTAKYDAVTANFTGTLQNGGSNVVVDSDIGSTVQAYDADLSTIAGLAKTDGNFIVGTGAAWTVESGATARTSLGLGTLATQNTITESQISDLGSYITASSTDTLTNKSGAISQWTNDSGYLTAEANDLTSAVTWANVPDVNITQSSVTQHQAALTITESQISDLQNYLTAETNDLGSAVTGTLPIANGGTGQTTAAGARIALLPTLGTAGQVLAVNTGTTDVEWVNPVSGSGSGTVTSVAISGTDGIEVDSGSPITTSGTIALGINAATLSSHLSLGTAATTAATDYATAAQGSLADSAVQPGDDAADLGSGAATDGYVLTADGAGGTAWEAASGGGGGSAFGRNLIINGDFRVNQRGAASRTATTNAYNYDRWYYDGTYLYQVIEDLNIVNGDYIISWSGSGLTAGWVISSNTTSSIPASFNTVTSGSSFTVSGKTTGDHLWIRFGGTLANLADVQVEAGTVATPFERRLIGTELALCQRYFVKMIDPPLRGVVGGVADASRTACSLPVQMRSAPTITLLQVGSTGNARFFDGGTATGIISSMNTQYSTTQRIELDFTTTANTYVIGRASCLFIDTAGNYSTAFNITAEL